jgi:ribosome-associated protein
MWLVFWPSWASRPFFTENTAMKPGKEKTEQVDGPSKSQLKRDSDALQELGQDLINAPSGLLEKCNLPDELVAALAEYRRLPNKHGALRRQLQYIGKLMRELPDESIVHVRAQFSSNVELEKRHFQQLESLRERLLDGDKAALEEVITLAPAADIQLLRQLIRQAVKEREQGAAPASSRKLFRLLREWQNQAES